MSGVVLLELVPVSHSQLSFIELFLVAAMPVHGESKVLLGGSYPGALVS